MTEQHLTLLQEEINSLLEFKEICIYEDEEKDIILFIHIEDNDENILRQDILDRYDNEEYWNERVLIKYLCGSNTSLPS